MEQPESVKESKTKVILKHIWNGIVSTCKFLFLNPYGFKLLSIILAIIVTVPFLCFKYNDEHPYASTVTGIALAMSVLWITNSINLGVTSLLPLFLFPLTGVMSGGQVSATYINNVSFIFIGGFIMALGMERWNLHKRISLFVMTITGKYLGLLLLGFMVTAYVLSMWISNTAAALIMVPNALTVMSVLEQTFGEKKVKPFSIGLLLGIAYACNIGGTATTVGTPPNLIFLQQYKIYYPDNPQPTFFQWMLFAVPISLTFLLIMYVYLYFVFCLRTSRAIFGTSWDICGIRKLFSKKVSPKPEKKFDLNVFKEKYNALGRISYEEIVVLIMFTILALLWITLAPIGAFPGWGSLFRKDFVTDGTVAMMCSFVLFLIPAFRDPPEEKKEKIEVPSITPIETIPKDETPTSMDKPVTVEQEAEKQHSTTKLDQVDQLKDVDQSEQTERKLDSQTETAKEDRESAGTLQVPTIKVESGDEIPTIPLESDNTTKVSKDFSINILSEEQSTKKPKKSTSAKSIMTWEALQNFPWDIIFLFGGGFALAEGVNKSGLAEILGNVLGKLSSIPAWVICLVICLLMSVLTSIASNTATTQVVLPILASLSKAVNLHPMFVMVPATLTASYAFALPVSTPVNAVVFAAKRLTVLDMLISGVFMNLIGCGLNLLFGFVLLPAVFQFDIFKP